MPVHEGPTESIALGGHGEQSLSLIDTAMAEFVDGAIGEVVRKTSADEPSLRDWLESELITAAGRRNFVRIGDPASNDRGRNVVAELERARLVTLEQRD